MKNRFPQPTLGPQPSPQDSGVVLAREECDNETLAPRTWSRLPAEILALFEETGFTLWRWCPQSGELDIQGAHQATTIEDWIARIHPEDQASFHAFLNEEPGPGGANRDIEYRLKHDGEATEWNRVRHTAVANRDQRSPVLSCLVEPAFPDDRRKRELERLGGGLAAIEQRMLEFVDAATEIDGSKGSAALLRSLLGALDADVAILAGLDNDGRLSRVIAQASNSAAIAPFSMNLLLPLLNRVLAPSDYDSRERLIATRIRDSRVPVTDFVGKPVRNESGDAVAVFLVGFNDAPSPEAVSGAKSLLSLSALFMATQLRYESEAKRRKEAEGYLRQSQKLSNVGKLASGIAHDFNNLLTVIQGHTSLLEISMESEGDERSRESLALIKSASQQAVDLARQLLLFGRNQAVHLEPCDLNAVLHDFVKMIRRMIEESIEFEIRTDPSIGSVNADKSMLGQVLMNLIVNARDAMPGGGKIEVATRKVLFREGNPDRAAPDGSYVCLSIRDTGAGIPPEKRKKIFDPFFSTKEKGKGTGLGLANVASIVQDHNGYIDVTSKEGEGTTFEILLPITDSPKKQADQPEEAGEQAALDGSIVLLVEDESAVRKLVRKLLEMLGCQVIEAVSGKQALDLWPEVCHDVSLVVSDIVMPEGVSGWDLAKELHRRDPNLGILLTSGYDESPDDHDLGEVANIAFLQKPYESKKLKSTLVHLLQFSREKA
ncbi:MAG: ATP-binding protein [Verrucomicrobiales bacterium]